MIKFREKAFATIKPAIAYVSKHPTLPIAVASLGVASGNAKINYSRHQEANTYQKKQLDAMINLTDSLKKVDKSIKTKSSDKTPTTVRRGIQIPWKKND